MKVQPILFVCLWRASSTAFAFSPKSTFRAAPRIISSASAVPNRFSSSKIEMDAEVISDGVEKKIRNNPTPVLFTALNKFFSNADLNKHKSALLSVTLAAALSFALAFASPETALAAQSGGRIGGSFGAAPRMSSPVPSRSFGGGGGGYYGGGGYRSGITIAPIITPGPFITPFYGPPMGFGGPSVITVSRGPSFFDLLFWGGFAFVLFNIFTSVTSGLATSGTELWTDNISSPLGNGVTVAKISICLQVPDRDDTNSILNVLGRLAQTARTDSRVGIQNLTSQIALELLRRKSSIVSAFTVSNHYNDKTKAQREFSLSAVRERGKFEQETVSQFGGVDYSAGAMRKRSLGEGTKATMAVVTLLIAIDGDSTKLPNVRSIADVEEALRRIASDAKVDDCLQSAEILWTPEDRTETLTLRDVVADYPELSNV